MKGILLFLRRHALVFTIVLLFLVATILYLYLQRLPETNDAFVVARIRPVSTRIDGFVEKIFVNNDQAVKKGTLLYQLEPKPFELALEQAKVNLQKGKDNVKALHIKIEQDKQIGKEKLLHYQTAQYNFENAKKLYEKGAYPKIKLTNLNRLMNIALAEYDAAKLQLSITENSLNQAKNNVQDLAIQIRKAKLFLSYTEVYALTDGIVSNLNLSAGTYVKAGQPLFAFVNTNTWWVQANIKETELGKVRLGDKAKITLRLYPHHEFHGVIDHIGWAVQRQKTDRETFLAEVANENQWFLLPQRFPVMIRILDADNPDYPLHVGASATVRIITKDD